MRGNALSLRVSAAPGRYFHSYPLHFIPWTAPAEVQPEARGRLTAATTSAMPGQIFHADPVQVQSPSTTHSACQLIVCGRLLLRVVLHIGTGKLSQHRRAFQLLY